MKHHKVLSVFILAILLVSLCAPGFTAAAAQAATPAAASLRVDGKPLSLTAYIINGSHYFMLRDLAKAVSGSEKQFEVVWDARASSVDLVAGKKYTPTGEEGKPAEDGAKLAVPSSLLITLGGYSTDYTAYLIGSNHYFKLRDIMSAFNIGVTWSQETGVITLDTSANYVQDVEFAPDVDSTNLLTTMDVADKSDSVLMIDVYDEKGEEIAQGSGFFVTGNGWIVTCFHVIDGAARVTATTESGKTYQIGSVLAYDMGKDTALLKANGVSQAPCLPVGDSDSLRRGQSVVVIGSPYGMQNTVSDGIVSNFRTDVGLRDEGTTDIQVTVPISSGSSGGPLFDLHGRVVGIIYATHLIGQNLNFAIPSNDFKVLFHTVAPISFETMGKQVDAVRAEQEDAKAAALSKQSDPQWNPSEQEVYACRLK